MSGFVIPFPRAGEPRHWQLSIIPLHDRPKVRCPGPGCLTDVRGGGLCSFCQKTERLTKGDNGVHRSK